MLVLIGHYRFEVATFRKDESYSDSRHPDSVTYSTSEEEDVLRRDFTINGMLYDPVVEEAIDFVGGTDDIRDGIIRTIGLPFERFNEDKLRLKRYHSEEWWENWRKSGKYESPSREIAKPIFRVLIGLWAFFILIVFIASYTC